MGAAWALPPPSPAERLLGFIGHRARRVHTADPAGEKGATEPPWPPTPRLFARVTGR